MEKAQICEHCGEIDSKVIDYQQGLLTCNFCGSVYEEGIIDDSSKERFKDDDKEHRVNDHQAPKYGIESSTNLFIHQKNKNKYVRGHDKLNKIQRNYIKIAKILKSKEVRTNLIEATKKYYEKVAKKMNMQGQKIKDIIIAIYYYVRQIENCHMTFKEIAAIFNTTERNIQRNFSKIQTYLVEEPKENEIALKEKNYIRNYLEFQIDKYEHKMLAFEILENFNKYNLLIGKNPKTVAGLALFLSYKLFNIELDDKNDFFSKFSKRSTLEKSYDEIKSSVNKFIPQKYLSEIYKLNTF